MMFFFQAEDGIRDRLVTGVHTCALPIYRRDPHLPEPVLDVPGNELGTVVATDVVRHAPVVSRNWNRW